MQGMREVIRGSLARSLRLLAEEDRIAAALPVVCGALLASHCEVLQVDQHGCLQLQVDSAEWMSPLLGMREVMRHELQRVAGVQLTGLHFVQAGSKRSFAERNEALERSRPWAKAKRPGERNPFLPKGRLS